MKIDISKLDKAAVLVALFNRSHQQGMAKMLRRVQSVKLFDAAGVEA